MGFDGCRQPGLELTGNCWATKQGSPAPSGARGPFWEYAGPDQVLPLVAGTTSPHALPK
jgi:hypothetical protein